MLRGRPHGKGKKPAIELARCHSPWPRLSRECVGRWAIILMLKIDILIVSLIRNYVDSTKAIITTTVRKENATLRSLASQSNIRVASNIACLSCVNRKRNMTCDQE